jgi:phage-related protein
MKIPAQQSVLGLKLFRWGALGSFLVPLGVIVSGLWIGSAWRVGFGVVEAIFFGCFAQTAWLTSTTFERWQTRHEGREVSEVAEGEPWCLVGNVVESHVFGDQKEVRAGSKHFSAETKVYCMASQWGDGYEQVVVIGLARRSRRWITVVMPQAQITNWRAKRVYQPEVLKRLAKGYKGFCRQWKSEEEVKRWVEVLSKE